VRENIKWSVTTFVAVVALVASFYSAKVQNDNYLNSKASLNEMRLQFLASGPKYSVTAAVSIYDTKSKKWSVDEKPGTVVPYEAMTAPSELYVWVSVTNIGRSRGSIQQAGLLKTSDARSPAKRVFCEHNKIVDCVFPVYVEPQQRVRLLFRLDGDLIKDLTCNEYAGLGMVAYAEGADEVVSQANTQVAVAYSRYCPVLPSAKKTSS
jgi:hypothetical protein